MYFNSLLLYKQKQRRKYIVSQQAQIEQAIINYCDKQRKKQASAVFFLEDLPTPMFIPVTALGFNHQTKLWYLSDPNTIPDGLVPESILQEPDQLQNVVDRVATLHKMLENQVNIVVFYVNSQRIKCRGNEAVDHSHIDQLKSSFPHNLQYCQIANNDYLCYQSQVSTATYCYGDPLNYAYVNATQCHKSHKTGINQLNQWTVNTTIYPDNKIEDLNKLLIDYNYPNIELMAQASKIINLDNQMEIDHQHMDIETEDDYMHIEPYNPKMN